MRRVFAVLTLIGALCAPGMAQRGATSTSGAGACETYISGYVAITDRSQRLAKGIEVRVMASRAMSIGTAASDSAFPTQVSRYTSDNGYFIIQGCDLGIAPQTFPPPEYHLYLTIRLDGYTEVFVRAKLNSPDNNLELRPGPSDLMDLTDRLPTALTDTDRLREELVRTYNELAVRQYEQGLRDILSNKADSAISNFQSAVKSAPAFFEAWMQLGAAEKMAKRLDEAEQAFQNATKIAPGAGEPLIESGTVLLDEATSLESAQQAQQASEKYAQATVQLKAGLARIPWSTDGHYYLGSALYKLNQLTEAESELQAAIGGPEPRQDARLMLVNVYIKEKRYDDAVTQLDNYAAAVPDSSQRAAVDQMRTEIANALHTPAPRPANSPLTRDRDLDAVIQRAVEYGAKYEAELGDLIGIEDYDQVAVWNTEQAQRLINFPGAKDIGVADSAPARRTEQRTLSDFLLIRVGSAWVPLREVNVVNGKKIQTNPNSFPFGDSPADNTRRFNSMKADSTKYNIGDVVREMNLPTFALEVLRRDEAVRFDFERNGSEKIGGVTAWKLKFREQRGKALVTSAKGQNIYSTGVLWINPDTGEVLKTEFDLDNRSVRPEIVSKVVVTYTSQPSIKILLPSLMTEHYEYGANVIDCKASYSNFRPFTVNVQFETGPPSRKPQ